ncbi:MAG: amino acid synthesis family protein [Gammaproteobacteria bacterium]|nr:amino acid synthesis family protein [Gammaproteobacteria bacterium]
MKEIRKIHVAKEELHLEAGRPVDPPLITIIVAAVMRNPWADVPYTDDLRTEIRRFAAPLGAILGERLIEEAGSPDAIQAYGKASVVGLDGELEHASAMVHTLLFGEEVRNRAKGASALVFANTRAAAGAQITVPMVHKGELLTRTHYHTAQTWIADAPRPDEVVVAVGAATGSRPFPRIGDRDTDWADIKAAAEASG